MTLIPSRNLPASKLLLKGGEPPARRVSRATRAQNISTPYKNKSISNAPLVFHVRRLRQWYGTEGLTQEELAAIAGVHPRTVLLYERATTIPASVNTFLAIVLALRQTSERVVAPQVLDRMRDDIEARRATFHEAPDFGNLMRGDSDAL